MNYDIYIDGVQVDTTMQTFVFTLDQTLDAGSFTIPLSTRKEIFKVYDEVIVLIDDGSTLLEYEFYIESDRVTPINISSSNVKYKHEITVVEKTKKLDEYVVEQRAFLQPAVGSKKSITSFVDDIINTVPFETSANLGTTRIMERGNTWLPLANVDAIEQVIAKSTLRELLNTYADMGNGIVRLRRKSTSMLNPTTYPHNILEIDYINERGTLRDKELNISGFENVQDMIDYVGTFDVSASNLVNEASVIGGLIYEPNETQWAGLRADEGSFVEASAYFPTEFGKFRKFEVKMLVPTDTQGNKTINITNYVLESEEIAQLQEVNSDSSLFAGFYQANSITWNYQDDKITGWYKEYDRVGTFGKRPAIENIIKSCFVTQLGWSSTTANSEYVAQDFQDLQIRVAYTGFFDARMQVEKQDVDDIEKNTTRILNQSDNIVSTVKVGNAVFNQIQVIGNQEFRTTTRSSDDLSQIFELGDYTSDGFIVTKKELIFKRSKYIARYEWTKNFQKQNQQISVNSKPELFAIPSDERVTKRNLFYKCYLTATTGYITPDTDTFVTAYGIQVLSNTFRQTAVDDKPPFHVMFRDNDIDIYKLPTGSYAPLNGTESIVKPITSWGSKNSLNFFWEFKSPNIAGQQVQYNNVTDSLGGLFAKPILRGVQYTDQYGELDTFDLEYVNGYSYADQDLLPLVGTAFGTDKTLDFNALKVIKNRADVLAMTASIQLANIETDTIVLGKGFVERNNMTEKYTTYKVLKVYAGSGRYDRLETETPKTGHTYIGTAIVNYDSTGFVVTVPNSAYDSWAIVDDVNDKVYLACNQRNLDGTFTTHNSVAFYLTKERVNRVDTY